ncbi:unnamed protein product [Albugo candida]|uniref:Uncharacterized protein n=1 Tax=Albugo candida TaxID=65357 RepID=A0A024GF88_9STRA|nr:unnamed protein product [Albugo candida]|eukprot:CCI44997.1 unnamed protein product [Albugo candida]
MRVWYLFVESLGNAYMRFRRVKGCLGRSTNNFSSKCFEDIYFFLRHLLGQCNDHAKSIDGRSQCKSDPGVSTCGFNQCVTWFNAATCHSIFNHPLPDTVFDGTPSIEEFTFGKQVTLQSSFFHNLPSIISVRKLQIFVVNCLTLCKRTNGVFPMCSNTEFSTLHLFSLHMKLYQFASCNKNRYLLTECHLYAVQRRNTILYRKRAYAHSCIWQVDSRTNYVLEKVGSMTAFIGKESTNQ